MSSPSVIPADLQSVIDTHRALFGEFRMSADQAALDAKPEADPEPSPVKPEIDEATPLADRPLGPSGEKALKTERDARRELERQLNQLRQGLAGLAGGGSDPKVDPEDAIASLTSRFDALTSDLEVERLARANGITDEKDIQLLRKTSADVRSDLASRLKPDTPQQTPTGRTPRFDHSVGKGSASGGGRPGSVAEAQQAYRDRRKRNNNA